MSFSFDIAYLNKVLLNMTFNNKTISRFAASVFAVFVLFSLMSVSCSESDSPQRNSRAVSTPSTPLMDLNAEKVVPLDKLNVDTKDPQALFALADQYFEMRNYAQASELYKKIIELEPKSIEAYNELGLTYHYTNKSSLAIDTLKKGIEINPSFQRIWLSYGFVLASMGKTDDAKTALGKAMELNPSNEIGQEAQRMLGSLR